MVGSNATLALSLSEYVSALCWEPSGEYLVSAGGEDRYIRVWHNRPGLMEQVKVMERRLSSSTSEPLKVCTE